VKGGEKTGLRRLGRPPHLLKGGGGGKGLRSEMGEEGAAAGGSLLDQGRGKRGSMILVCPEEKNFSLVKRRGGG